MKKTISKIKLLLSMALMLIILSGRLVNVDAMSSDTQSTQPKEALSGERLKDEAGLLSDDEAMQMIILISTVMDWVRTGTEFFCFCQWKTAIGRLVLMVSQLQPLPMQARTI